MILFRNAALLFALQRSSHCKNTIKEVLYRAKRLCMTITVVVVSIATKNKQKIILLNVI